MTANMGTGGHNVPIIKDMFGIRKLTPDECLHLQGFPKSFKFLDTMANCHKYKQAGKLGCSPRNKKYIKKYMWGHSIEKEKWVINLTQTEPGIFRTMNGNTDELIGNRSCY